MVHIKLFMAIDERQAVITELDVMINKDEVFIDCYDVCSILYHNGGQE